MEAIYKWNGESFTLLYGGINTFGRSSSAEAFVNRGSFLDNGTIFNRRIYLKDRVVLPGTYLHELAHLTRLVGLDNDFTKAATPFEATLSGHFYNQIANSDIGMVLNLQLTEPLMRSLGFSDLEKFNEETKCCSFSTPFIE